MIYKGKEYESVRTRLDTEWLCGYTQKTYLWDMFTEADADIQKVRLKFFEVFNWCCKDTVYISELALVMYWKLLLYFNKRNEEYYETYKYFYQKLLRWANKNLSGEDLEYFKKTQDQKKRKH